MRSQGFLTAAMTGLAFIGSPAMAASYQNSSSQKEDPAEVLKSLQAAAILNIAKGAISPGGGPPGGPPGGPASGCNILTANVRRDWEDLERHEKKDYIRAVQCLWDLPSRGPKDWPAQNHFDDFVGIHMNRTDFNETGNFLSWHRMFVHGWESKLRDECGYKGYMPYWNWFKYQDDLSKSPVFDGSDTSIGGNGAFWKHNGSLGAAGTLYLPSGEGGGCVESGPFKDRKINLGPILPGMQDVSPIMTSTTQRNGPRCLRRDFTKKATSEYDAEQLRNLTIGAASASIGLFQEQFQVNKVNHKLGLHGAGHYGVGGDMSDAFGSPNDPVFYMHHAMVDQIWWIWQSLHPDIAHDLEGTNTYNNEPPSADTTLDDVLDMGVATEHVPIRKVMDTLGGDPLCYIYG